ncbi:MAG: exodeoxyribonuclease VII small subunit [Phycisphaerales bacterium]|jgi:exodeoxyribonuclease VII small subunit
MAPTDHPSSGSASGPSPIPADMPYESAIAELESIVQRIESGEMGLEEQLAAYERGKALEKHCQTLLARAEQRFADLTAQMNAESPKPSKA